MIWGRIGSTTSIVPARPAEIKAFVRLQSPIYECHTNVVWYSYGGTMIDPIWLQVAAFFGLLFLVNLFVFNFIT
jgi:hypothetical protein